MMSTMHRSWAALLALSPIAFATPSQLDAQAVGFQLAPGSIRAEYYGEVLTHVNALDADWAKAFSRDDLDDLMELYADDAVVIPGEGAPLLTLDHIRGFLEEFAQQTLRIEFFMQDFDASGQMAVVYGNWRALMSSGPDAGNEVTGPIVTVYMQIGRSWRIRSQMLRRYGS